MTDKKAKFDAMVSRFEARMADLKQRAERDGGLLAASISNPDNRVLLTRGMSPGAGWRVTSFHKGQPVGHREYDRLDGGSPIANALQEFMSDDLQLINKRPEKQGDANG